LVKIGKHKDAKSVSKVKGKPRKILRKVGSGQRKMQSSAKDLRQTEKSSQDPFTGTRQILDPEGELVGKDPLIPNDILLNAYRNMVLTRILDERLIGLQRQGRMGTYVSCSGQEASQIGTVLALSKEKDWIFPMYRDLGMIIQAGVSIKELANRMMGNAEDLSRGRDLPNLFAWKEKKIVSFAAPIASHLPLATGFAMAAKLRRDNLVAITTFGDGATSSGEFHVAMNFAGVYRAPVVFVCENNQYAISVPVSRQTASESIAIKALAYGFEGIRVDGNDIFAVYVAIKGALEKARNGEGPTLVECVTYRIGSHSTADDWKKYRSPEEVDSWKKKDPIVRLKKYLVLKRKIWSEEKEAKLRSEIETEIALAISASEKIPPPKVKTLFEDVYARIPKNLEDQMKEELAS
jgi:pyruvate dehydrogenase E1 component alpha subunit